jgi:hypothetical protein
MRFKEGKTIIIFIVGLTLTLTLLWPMVVAPYYKMHDDVQVIRLYEMNKCFQDFQIPCRWVPDLGGLYGYPLFNYYAPLPYYIGELFYFSTHNFIVSAKLMFASSFILSYIFMFFLGRKIWGDLGGLLSGIFYSFAPYHSVDMYVRGAMGEMWALVFFPAILWAAFRLNENQNIRNLLILSFFIMCLVITHNLSAMIFMPILIGYIVVMYFIKRNTKLLYFSFFSIMLGFLLSAFYFIPALVEKNLAHVETTTYGYFYYTEHFKGLRKLFLDNFWGWGASIREIPGGEKDMLPYQIGWVHLIGFALSLVAGAILFKKDKLRFLIIYFSFLVFLGAVFMIHPKSEPIWKNLDQFLRYLQFPWRFLMVVIFVNSFMVGSIVYLWEALSRSQHTIYKYLLAGVLITLVIVVNFSYFRPEKFLYTNDVDYLTGENWDRQIKRSIFDYLPKSAKAPPAELAKSPYRVIIGSASVNDFYQGSNWVKFNLAVIEPSQIEISQYYFPVWKIQVDGKEVPIDYNNDLGLMRFMVDPGNHTVEARLHDTIIRKMGNFLTIIGFLVSIILVLSQYRKTRKYFLYMLKGLNR